MRRRVLDPGRRGSPTGAPPLAFLNRMQALADVYRLVSRAKWGDVPLQDLVTNELEHFGIGRDGRVSADAEMLQLIGHEVLKRHVAPFGAGHQAIDVG